MKEIKTRVAIWVASAHGERCQMCGKKMADYNKLHRYLESEKGWRAFYAKRRDGLCYACKNPTCTEYEKDKFMPE